MQHPDRFQQRQQVALDHKLFQALRQLHIVETQYDFSRLLGRSQGYFSSLQCRQVPMSAAALARLNRYLRGLGASERDVRRHYQLASVSADLESEIAERLR